jgi:HK97 gp10 family phage protein
LATVSEGFLFADFLNGIKEAEHFLNVAATPIILEIGEQVVVVAKALAPVDTDALQQDIKVEGTGVDNKGTYVDVGTTEPYALYQEFGTIHNPPHPFMRPAIAQITGGAFSSSAYLAEGGVKKFAGALRIVGKRRKR